MQRVPVRISLDSVENAAADLPRGEDGKPWLPVGLSVDVRLRVR